MKEQTLTISSRTEELMEVREFVSRAAVGFGFPEEEVSKIALAVDEACTNIIKHAYRQNPGNTIKITVVGNDTAFEVVIRDHGASFDPSDVHSPDMKEYLTQFRRGGLGVYLMKTLMDKVEYDMRPGVENSVRLVKFLPH